MGGGGRNMIRYSSGSSSSSSSGSISDTVFTYLLNILMLMYHISPILEPHVHN